MKRMMRILSKNKRRYTWKKINVLTFGKNSIAVNKTEYDVLVDEYDNYVEENGVDFGFVNYLLNKIDKEENGDS